MAHMMRILLVLTIISTAGLSIVFTGETINAQSFTNPASSDSLKGALTSIQNDPTDNNTNWIISGVFRMNNMSSTTSPIFNATFYMVKTDGTALHKHQIYDLRLTGEPSTAGNSTTYNGTTTVIMKGVPVKDVPISIALMDDSAVSIWLDPTKVKNHFGDTPIYGTQHLICVEEAQYCK